VDQVKKERACLRPFDIFKDYGKDKQALQIKKPPGVVSGGFSKTS
jgi:hypothetical protein